MSGTRSAASIIDSLLTDPPGTAEDLAARLVPVLNVLLYSAEMGEGAVLEVREDWHTQYGRRLRRAQASDAAAAAAAATAVAEEEIARKALRESAREPAAETTAQRRTAGATPGRTARPGRTRRGAPAPAGESLPPSLRALFESRDRRDPSSSGSH